MKSSNTPSASSVCKCGAIVFFENSVCLRCGRLLGYVSDLGRVISFQQDAKTKMCTAEDVALKDQTFRCCGHRDTALGCNWMISAEKQGTLCDSCQLTRTFPDNKLIGNGTRWSRAEMAKRRVAAQIVRLGIPLVSQLQNPRGVCFDFLQNPANGAHVLTGHEDGVITLNINEADDLTRESMRMQMGEEYRTLAGHIRHEIAHYYWDVLATDADWLTRFRQLFGDEQNDYNQALSQYYAQGSAPDWNSRFITPYASAHAWEDWAETFAHYLHFNEGLHVARTYGLEAAELKFNTEHFEIGLLNPPEPKKEAQAFLNDINAWVKLSVLNNEMARALGHHDVYPFVLSKPVVAKLWFIRQSLPKISQTLTAAPRQAPVNAPVVNAPAPQVAPAPAVVVSSTQ